MNHSLNHLGKREYVFSELSNLRLHDIKAQKKTMSMKKFRNIPLNNQEVMELKFNHNTEEEMQTSQQFYQTQFRIRIGRRRKDKLLQRLSNPKCHHLQKSQNESMKEISSTESIIRKCSKLKDKILTQNRIQKVQKYTDRQYNTLLQQSKWCLAVHCKKL